MIRCARPRTATRRALALVAACLSAVGCRAADPAVPGEASTAAVTSAFEAAAAWDEFEGALRLYYAYLEREDLDVDALLARARAAALTADDAGALRRTLRLTTYAFTDPHLLVGPLDDSDPNVWPTSGDLAVSLAGDAFVVADVRAGSAADAAGVRPGWRVEEVDGRPIDEAAAALLALVPAPTARQRAYAATLAVNGRRSGGRALTLRPDGGPSRALSLANPRDLAREVAARPPLEVRVVDGVGVIRLHNSLGRLDTIQAFDAAVERCRGLDALVLDLRDTPSGGNSDVARAVIGHFVTEARPYQVHEVPAVERRTSVPRRFVELVAPRAPHFSGRVAVLGGRWTGSMGEGLVIGLHTAAGARTFCSDMGDLLGALHTFPLAASGAVLELGAEALFHVDGTPREAYVADVPLRSADRDAAGGDPALAAALEWLGAPR